MTVAKTFALELVGEVPGQLDVAPLQAVVAVVTKRTDELGLVAGTINLAFVDDVEMQRMNREYSGNDYATDVLSFNYLEDGEAIDGVVGEMVISLDTATRQAAAAGTTLAEEVALLGLHGILHISGHDHQTPDEQAAVQAIQSSVLTEAGVAYREFVWQD